MIAPFEVKVAGELLPLKCDSLRARCGGIKDGIAFHFGDLGGWVVDYKQFIQIAKAATKARKRKKH